MIRLDRFLFSSVVYPTDYGFIPDTLSLDGDPLDVMVLVSEPTFPGCMIEVKPIGLFRMEDDQGIDDKVLCRPAHRSGLEHAREPRRGVRAAPERDRPLLHRLQAASRTRRWRWTAGTPCEDALKVIAASRDRFTDSSGTPTRVPPPCRSSRQSSSGSCRGSPSSCRSRAPAHLRIVPAFARLGGPRRRVHRRHPAGDDGGGAPLLPRRSRADRARLAALAARPARRGASTTRGWAGTSCSARSRSGSSASPSRTRSRTARATST